MNTEWWRMNWVLVMIGVALVVAIGSSLIWPDSTMGCSVQIDSRPST